MTTEKGWIWLDGIDDFVKATSVRAWKQWKASFPSSYLVEFIAQAGAILLGAESDFKEDVIFTKIEGVQFLSRPETGKRLDIEVEPESLRREGGWFLGRIFQEGKRIAEGRVLLMNIGRLRPDGDGPITFPEQLIEGFEKSVKP